VLDLNSTSPNFFNVILTGKASQIIRLGDNKHNAHISVSMKEKA